MLRYKIWGQNTIKFPVPTFLLPLRSKSIAVLIKIHLDPTSGFLNQNLREWGMVKSHFNKRFTCLLRFVNHTLISYSLIKWISPLILTHSFIDSTVSLSHFSLHGTVLVHMWGIIQYKIHQLYQVFYYLIKVTRCDLNIY